MSASGEYKRPGRKGQYSCDFCRSRKLRCDRPLPCTSYYRPDAPDSGINSFQQQQVVKNPLLPQPQLPGLEQRGLLAEIQALRKLTQDLEERIVQSTTVQQQCVHGGDSVSLEPTASSASGGKTKLALRYWAIKVEHIQAIPQAPAYIVQLGKPLSCVWLPHHAEARLLLDHYITRLSYIQHVVHHPSLQAIVDDVYQRIADKQPVKPGSIILLLSIIASATHVWTPCDDGDMSSSLFSSSAQANVQTPLWIKATYNMLDATRSSAALALETIQGIIILSFIVCNLEGVSLQYRSLISTGLLLGRELGFHRIDQESNAATANTLQAEMGRRVWWYLVSTDWLMAARYGGPGEGVYQAHLLHMMVEKPHNINDIDLTASGLQLDLPLSQPTDMSYFLQRIRLAEISRNIVDHNLMALTSPSRPSYYAHVTSMDFELDQMIHNMPTFFQLESYELSSDSNKTSGIFIQAYLLNSLVHTQRCKLHLAYLTSRPNGNPAYVSSREACLKSARRIIRAEAQLLRSQHSFVQVRLRLAAILHSIFVAGIVLLMDACVSRPNMLEDEILEGDLAEALRIIQDASNYSLAAAKLHGSLMEILAKHRDRQQQRGHQAKGWDKGDDEDDNRKDDGKDDRKDEEEGNKKDEEP
ncbi:hypothetical protein N0V83_005650 [Neocucurbitaria cava]|uniref:Xylanolytic transcriptional activator regulatory domain-containing protein n=1 Tax=Neocucurbitaria cava TaxID=798079 RepID=A0A9W8Y9A0_9PLEO|nr:hypothetical protein N0V83_005650 [Neocucurbitaria cava]